MKTKHWIMVFVGLALVLLAILLLRPKQSGLVGIYRDGKLIETVDLTKDRTIPLDGAAGGATAAVQDGEIYMDETDDVCCIWRVDVEEKICTYCMDIFRRSGKLWSRDTEIHEERVYSPEEILEMLRGAGFIDSEIFGDRSAAPPEKGELRLFFVARKEELQ